MKDTLDNNTSLNGLKHLAGLFITSFGTLILKSVVSDIEPMQYSVLIGIPTKMLNHMRLMEERVQHHFRPGKA